MPASVKNLKLLSQEMALRQNILVGNINDHCLRLAVNEDSVFDWHEHPKSDELFLVLEGELAVEFKVGEPRVMKSGDFFTVPAGTVHRTIARGRTVNLCFEKTIDSG